VILGRNPALWLGAVAAVLNVAVVVFGIALTVDQLAALNVAAGAIIGVVANESAAGTVGTFEASKTPVK
jgi:anti-sigma-K factor RskA